MRFFVMTMLCALAPVFPCMAQQPTGAAPAPPAPVLLWPSGAPGAIGTADTDKPALYVYLPSVPNPTKTGVVVAPGGGYHHLAMEKEGFAVARWLNQQGIAAFVLRYRLGPEYHHPTESVMRSARSAMCVHMPPSTALRRIAWGCGGSLPEAIWTATAGTQFDAGHSDAADPVEHEGSRPQFLVLAYPVITLMDPAAQYGIASISAGR